MREAPDDETLLVAVRGGDRAEAEDLTQEAFVGAFRGAVTFRGGSGLLTWLLAIAHRRWRDKRRRPPSRPAWRPALVFGAVATSAAALALLGLPHTGRHTAEERGRSPLPLGSRSPRSRRRCATSGNYVYRRGSAKEPFPPKAARGVYQVSTEIEARERAGARPARTELRFLVVESDDGPRIAYAYFGGVTYATPMGRSLGVPRIGPTTR